MNFMNFIQCSAFQLIGISKLNFLSLKNMYICKTCRVKLDNIKGF